MAHLPPRVSEQEGLPAAGWAGPRPPSLAGAFSATRPGPPAHPAAPWGPEEDSTGRATGLASGTHWAPGVKAQHEGALPPPCIVRKDPRVPHTKRPGS